jgi:hypothetical protein
VAGSSQEVASKNPVAKTQVATLVASKNPVASFQKFPRGFQNLPRSYQGKELPGVPTVLML